MEKSALKSGYNKNNPDSINKTVTLSVKGSNNSRTMVSTPELDDEVNQIELDNDFSKRKHKLASTAKPQYFPKSNFCYICYLQYIYSYA